jgi:hypothetical protein
MNNVFIKIIVLTTLTTMLASCNAGNPNINSSVAPSEAGVGESNANSAHCESKVLTSSALPSMVLVGTDVVERGTFVFSSVESGDYAAEIGGANISLTLSINSTGVIMAKRGYREPGIPIVEKNYQGLCAANNEVIGDSIYITFVEGGLLLLETDADNQFIPNDLFIFLKEDK